MRLANGDELAQLMVFQWVLQTLLKIWKMRTGPVVESETTK